jgi:hypothetical protein
MPGVGAAVVANDNVTVLGKDVHDFALAFVAPLQSYNTAIHTRPQ